LLIFPFLPNYSIDPYDVINLREVGLMVLVTSGLSFIGYILMRVFGIDYVILLNGIVVGIISTMMLTCIFTMMSKVKSSEYNNLIFIFKLPLFKDLLVPISLIILTSLALTLYYNYKAKKQPKEDLDIPLGKPLNLRTAVFFAALYMGVLLFISFSNEQFGDKG